MTDEQAVSTVADPDEDWVVADLPTAPPARAAAWPWRLLRWCWQWICNIALFFFGAFSLVTGLSILVVLPVVNLLTLGYFLESARRVAETGRFRTAFPGLPIAARFGSIVLGLTGLSIPYFVLREQSAGAFLVDDVSPATQLVGRLAPIVGIFGMMYGGVAVLRGGRFRDFVRPIANLRWLIQRLRHPGEWRSDLAAAGGWLWRLPIARYFVIGLRGYLASVLWLIPPTMLLAGGKANPGFGLIGAVLLAYVVGYLPFLQVHGVVVGTFKAHFDRATIKELFHKAPSAYLITLLLLLTLSIPLYLGKIEPLPSDAWPYLASIFIITIFPVKLFVAWAYHRAVHRPKRAWWIHRQLCRLLLLPVVLIYTGLVFLSQFTSWLGQFGLLEHHAFLLPAPF